jgi:molecular chaperone DnaK
MLRARVDSMSLALHPMRFANAERDSEDNDNRFHWNVRDQGSDFDDGVIAAGVELVCEYEVLDSGNITMEVAVPSIGGSFHSGRNFRYARQRASQACREHSEVARCPADHLRTVPACW